MKKEEDRKELKKHCIVEKPTLKKGVAALRAAGGFRVKNYLFFGLLFDGLCFI